MSHACPQACKCIDPSAVGVDYFAASVLEGEDNDLQAIRRWGLQWQLISS